MLEDSLKRTAARALAMAIVAAAAIALAALLCAEPATAQELKTASPSKPTAAIAKKISFKAAKFVESGKYLNNPYRGWYAPTTYTLSETSAGDAMVSKRLVRDLKSSEYASDLVLIEFNLKNYNGRGKNPSNIGEKARSQVERALDCWQKKGKHVIVRLLYDSVDTTVENTSLAGDARSVEPKSLGTLKSHITQLAPIINDHKETVYMVQGTSMGAWGEMHSSNFMPDIEGSRAKTHANVRSVLAHMGRELDKSIFLAVRRPSYYRSAVSKSALTKKTGFKGALASRVALFNDGMFGTESDTGTYDASRKSEVAFQDKHCRFVPNGGEAITDATDKAGKPVITDWNRFSTKAIGKRAKYGKSLIDDMRAMHVSYLNNQWHTAVIADWKKTRYTGKGAFRNMSGASYIERHLGYRYVLRSAQAKTSGASKARITLEIANVGFSPAYRSMKSQLALVNSKGKTVARYRISSDNRLWPTGTTKKLTKTISLKNVPRGTYTLRYSLTDIASGKQISFGNTAKKTRTGYSLGILRVR